MSISQENAAKMLKVEKERAPIKASASRKGLGGEKGATSDNYQSTVFFAVKRAVLSGRSFEIQGVLIEKGQTQLGHEMLSIIG